MRIAFVYDALYPETKGGVERRVWELARLLVRQGHSIDLLVPKLWTGADVIDRDGVVVRAVCRGRGLYRQSGRRALFPSIAHAIGVFRALRGRDYDVVDCQVPAHLACFSTRIAVKRRPATRQTITWHEAWGAHWLDEFGLLGHVGRLFEARLARLPVTHISVSNSTAGAMRGLGREPDAVVEAGVDLEGIDAIARSAGADVSFVGRLVPSKNLGLLLESIRLMSDSGRTVSLTVVGDGPSRGQWERMAADLHLAQTVTFVGALSDWESVMAIVKGSKVLALPSLREGFGLIALEAAACGVPVVTADHPRNAARELVEHGQTGLVVAPTPDIFAAAISSILDDDRLRSHMGDMALQRAVEAGWGRTAGQTIEVYERGAA